MPAHSSRYISYNRITVYRRTNAGKWTKVDTYKDATLAGAEEEYEQSYLHDEQRGTEIIFVAGGEILTLVRIEVPEPVRRLVGVAIR